MLKNMTAKEAVSSKAMLAGVILCALGVWVVIKGDTNMGILAFGNGLGIMGIRDNNAG